MPQGFKPESECKSTTFFLSRKYIRYFFSNIFCFPAKGSQKTPEYQQHRRQKKNKVFSTLLKQGRGKGGTGAGFREEGAREAGKKKSKEKEDLGEKGKGGEAKKGRAEREGRPRR